ncbi:unnamed protein product [Durusdinium trenchii]|uniref:Uncharacterized protein n=1 Tax=Durusdinium trenchii TaxID=1381693 RepID=A0ABP0I0Y6_9DINO
MGWCSIPQSISTSPSSSSLASARSFLGGMKALKECELGESVDFESLLIWHMVIRELAKSHPTRR